MRPGPRAVEIAGLHVAYRLTGGGAPIVLLHGALGDHRDWRPQLAGMSADFTVVAWDAPGHGHSDDPPPTWRAVDYVDCLVAFIEALDLGRPHVLGLSWGSTLALALYARRPDLPRSLVLASAYAGWAGSLPAHEVTRRREMALRQADLPPESFVADWIPTLLTPRAPASLVRDLTTTMSAFHPAGLKALIRAFAHADLRDMLPTIATPTLLLYGAADVRSPPAVGIAMQARIPDSELVVLPDVGHLCNLEAPERFNRVVHDFVSAR